MEHTRKYRDFDVPYNMAGSEAVLRRACSFIRLGNKVDTHEAIEILVQAGEAPHTRAWLNHDKLLIFRKSLRIDAFVAVSLLNWLLYDKWLYPLPHLPLHDSGQIVIQPQHIYRAEVAFPPGYDTEAAMWREHARAVWFMSHMHNGVQNLWSAVDTGLVRMHAASWTQFMRRVVALAYGSMEPHVRSAFVSMLCRTQHQHALLSESRVSARATHIDCFPDCCNQMWNAPPPLHYPQLQLQRGGDDTTTMLSNPVVVEAFVFPHYAFVHKSALIQRAHVSNGTVLEPADVHAFVHNAQP
jgi:hypothetical protein